MARKSMPGDFARFWAALSVSLMGSEITTLALPLLAALTLSASALEMGVLAAAGQLPFLLFSLPAGAWVDRLPRRPVLIATDVASVLLLSVPAAVPFGGPTFPQLCIVAFGVGTMAVVSEVAQYAYVPPWWAATT
jgi:MFS family permease